MSRNQGITHAPSVLFVTTVAITLEAFLLPFARALRAQGSRVDALAADALTTPGISEEFDQRFEIGWSRSVRCLLHYPRLARDLRALVKREGYETVWVHTPIAALVTRAALRKVKIDPATLNGRRAGSPRPTHKSGLTADSRGTSRANALEPRENEPSGHSGAPKIVYTAHGFHFYRGGHPAPQQWFYRFIERLALRWTDVLVVMNDEDEAAAQRWFSRPQPRKRCQLVRIDGIGVDSAAWAPLTLSDARIRELREHFGIPMGSFVITMIAEMNANKRHKLLIEAVAQLQHQHALPWMRLLLIGQGPLESELREMVAARGLDEMVSFTGQLSPDELRELLALTNVGMLVSEREGLPRSLMEMCASGVLLAGTQTRGIIDEVADERALTSEPTVAALAALIEKLAKSPTLRAELTRKQHEHLQKRYTLDRILPQYLELLTSPDK
ncbi:MAG: glycosyltransferase [Coriobacteriia bacterium]|nr:glycosyltransferase [Coriobacteriia bacterium]